MSASLNVYVCGPIVIEESQMGERIYVTADIIVRNLRRSQRTYFVSSNNMSTACERKFLDNMESLNVKSPDTVIRENIIRDYTRDTTISDSVTKDDLKTIEEYIQKIYDNGFAYQGLDNTIYFDSGAYERAGYTCTGSTYMCEDIEMQSSYIRLNVRKDERDFALWEACSLSEVGANIILKVNYGECSLYGNPGRGVQTVCRLHQLFGSKVDLYLGNMKFIDCERMQAQAYYHPQFRNWRPWAPTTISIGDLNISGTSTVLESVTPDQLRLMLTLNDITEVIDFNPENIRLAKERDTMLQDLFINSHSIMGSNIRAVENVDDNATIDLMRNHFRKYDFVSGMKLMFELISGVYGLFRDDVFRVKALINNLLFELQTMGFTYHIKCNSKVDAVLELAVDSRSFLRNLAEKTNDNSIRREIYAFLSLQRTYKFPMVGYGLTDTDTSSIFYPIRSIWTKEYH